MLFRSLAKLPDDAPVLRGETFYTNAAIDLGLADGLRTFDEAVAEAAALGEKYASQQFVEDLIYNSI